MSNPERVRDIQIERAYTDRLKSLSITTLLKELKKCSNKIDNIEKEKETIERKMVLIEEALYMK